MYISPKTKKRLVKYLNDISITIIKKVLFKVNLIDKKINKKCKIFGNYPINLAFLLFYERVNFSSSSIEIVNPNSFAQSLLKKPIAFAYSGLLGI